LCIGIITYRLSVSLNSCGVILAPVSLLLRLSVLQPTMDGKIIQLV
jgi:hypothetical protein